MYGSVDLAVQASVTLTNRQRPVEVSPYDVVQFNFTTSGSAEAEAPTQASRVAEPGQPQAPASIVEEVPAEQESIIDDELLAVFIEEAGEVQAQLTEGVTGWVNDQDDLKAMKDVRRAF
ncbi:hypothetical protein, partial [Endozoicomonas sp. SESOKO2]|uniref:hypothetical protein n=1 Tax=Endozoicomonas sp. SESOKO2 TaxID=2828743 RepID=UPI002147A955